MMNLCPPIIIHHAETMEWSESKSIPDFGRCSHCTTLISPPAGESSNGEGVDTSTGGAQEGAGVDDCDGGGSSNSEHMGETSDDANDGKASGGELALICGGFDGVTTIYDDVKLLDLGIVPILCMCP